MAAAARSSSSPATSTVRVFSPAGSTFTVTSLSTASVPNDPAISLHRS